MTNFWTPSVFESQPNYRWVSLGFARSSKLFHLDHGIKHGPGVVFYDTELVYTTAKPNANGD